MCNHCDARSEAQAGIQYEGEPNGDAIHGVVHSVADQDEGAGLGVLRAVYFVAMPPDEQFFQNEKPDDAHQHRREGGPGGQVFQGVGEHAETGRPKHGAGGVAENQVPDVGGKFLPPPKEQAGQQGTADAAEHAE